MNKRKLILASLIKENENEATFQTIEELQTSLTENTCNQTHSKKPFFIQFCQPFARDNENSICAVVESSVLDVRSFVMQTKGLSLIKSPTGNFAWAFTLEESLPNNQKYWFQKLSERIPEFAKLPEPFIPISHYGENVRSENDYDHAISTTYPGELIVRIASFALLASNDLLNWEIISETNFIDSFKTNKMREVSANRP